MKWPLQRWFQSPYIGKSDITTNAKAGSFSPDFFDPYPARAIEAVKHIHGHISRKKCTYWELGWIYAILKTYIQSCHWWKKTSQMLPTQFDLMNDDTDNVMGLPQWLPKSHKGIYCSMDHCRILEKRSQIVTQFWMGIEITPKHFKVASRYNSQLSLSIITFGTWLDDQVGWLYSVRHLAQLNSISSIIHQWLYTDVPI